MSIRPGRALLGLALCCFGAPLAADDDPRALRSLEDLLKTKVRVVSRQDESAFEAPAALTVITREDIRSGGFTRLVEVLRLVPGMHVVRSDANKWGVNTRQGPQRFASTILVQMDGRSLYTTLHNGVYWEVQDYPLEDIERIEVIRGPGAALWGVNAVSGVINIVTRRAEATQGTLLSGRGGGGDVLAEGTVRHGGRLGSQASYRVYAHARRTDRSEIPQLHHLGGISGVTPGDRAEDRGEFGQLGFRLDQRLSESQELTLDLGLYRGQFHDYRVSGGVASPNLLHARGAHGLARWTHRGEDGQETQLQLYHDWTDRDDLSFEDSRNVSDVDLQHSRTAGIQRVTLGVGLRYVEDATQRGDDGVFQLNPANDKQQIVSAFLHDRLTLREEELFLIAGSKFEYGEYTEMDAQPSVRLLLTPSYRTTLWGGWTSAARTPSRTGLHGELNFGGFVTAIGDPDAESLRSRSYELGVRRKLGEPAELDLAAFYDDYDEDVRTTEGGDLKHVVGLESSYRQQRGDWIRWELSHVFHQATRESGDDEGLVQGLPRHSAIGRVLVQFTADSSGQLFLSWNSPRRTTDGSIELSDQTRADLVLRQRIRPGWELSLAGANLLDAARVESFQETRLATAQRRAVWLRLTVER